ncbi:acyl dehydratase [Bosea sp. OAE506]|uniref:PilZ domain-containing protein n=1 Tax=Bosea sp. OAE506 TaxID=2663870 RepID=UPI00178945C1
MDLETKRQFRRVRMVEPAHIIAAGSARAYASMLIDLSAGGARLRVSKPFAVNDKIRVSSTALGGEREADVVWSDATSIGVRFKT